MNTKTNEVAGGKYLPRWSREVHVRSSPAGLTWHGLSCRATAAMPAAAAVRATSVASSTASTSHLPSLLQTNIHNAPLHLALAHDTVTQLMAVL